MSGGGFLMMPVFLSFVGAGSPRRGKGIGVEGRGPVPRSLEGEEDFAGLCVLLSLLLVD